MTHIDNKTSFPSQLFSFPGIDGQEEQVLVVAATYSEASEGELQPAPEQRPVRVADEYFGDPAISSVRYEAEVAAEKTRIDFLVNGTAYAPGGRAVEDLVVEFHAREIQKRIRVVGDRFNLAGGSSLPEPFTTMPVIYERAFGGTNAHSNQSRYDVWKANPVGVGFRNARSQSPEIRTDYPNLEPVGSSNKNMPAGFGVISRGWSPRLEWAGTFDQEWLDTQWPLMPGDFDLRHYQAAPLDQQVDSLRTGDLIRLVNLTADGSWAFALPPTELPVWLIFSTGLQERRLRVDTVLIEPDSRSLALIFRLKLVTERRQQRLQEIVVGPLTPGMLHAKRKRKPYLDLRKLAGRDVSESGVA